MLQFHLFDWDNNKREVESQDKLGWTELTLAEVMSNGGAPLSRTLNKGGGGILLVVGEEVVATKVRGGGIVLVVGEEVVGYCSECRCIMCRATY